MAKAKPKMYVKLHGQAELTRRLNALPEKVMKKVLSPAVRAGAKAIAEGVKQYMPTDSGAARRAITVRAAKRSRKKQVKSLVLFKTDKVRAASRKKSAPEGFFYPAVLEYGSRKLGRMPVAPMRRGGQSRRDEADRAITDTIRQGIRREAAALGFETK
jgi:cell division protein YceG involved in septum cleavage